MPLTTFELVERSGEDGILRFSIPVAEPSRTYRVIVLIEEVNAGSESVADIEEKRPWSPGFFERTYGQWKGELERPSQGEAEQREDL
jgi:hypothetical protein